GSPTWPRSRPSSARSSRRSQRARSTRHRASASAPAAPRSARCAPVRGLWRRPPAPPPPSRSYRLRTLRVAALYDVHGNLPALEAVLADVARERVDAIVVGGDFAAGPMPVETFDRLRGLGDRALFLSGNAERELADGMAPAEELGHARFEWLRDELGAE